jgi:hypothetical protein
VLLAVCRSAEHVWSTHILLWYDHIDSREICHGSKPELVPKKALHPSARARGSHREVLTSSQYWPVSTTLSPPAERVNIPSPSLKSFPYLALYSTPDLHALPASVIPFQHLFEAKANSRLSALSHESVKLPALQIVVR